MHPLRRGGRAPEAAHRALLHGRRAAHAGGSRYRRDGSLSHGIERIFVLGNHNDYKLRDAAVCAFYHRLFDEISLVVRIDDAICTHFPLGYSRAAAAAAGTPDEKYYRMARTFAQLDARLLDEGAAINLHGHIHAGPFRHGVPGVEYHNVALDVVAGGLD